MTDGEESSLVPGLHRLRAECLDRLGADTFVVFDTHWFTLVEMVVTSHGRRTGNYTSDELPSGMPAMPYDIPGDPELAEAEAPASVAADHDCGTAGADDFELWGRLLGEAIESLDRRVVLLASGGLSHRFWPLNVFRDHESSSLDNIITPEARAADEAIIARREAGAHAAVIDGYSEFRAHAPEGLFGHYLMMVGALGGRDCRAPGIAYSDYEAAAGTGQIHMWFERPDSGWTA